MVAVGLCWQIEPPPTTVEARGVLSALGWFYSNLRILRFYLMDIHISILDNLLEPISSFWQGVASWIVKGNSKINLLDIYMSI